MTTAATYCPKCGTQRADGAAFCAKCGQAFDGATPAQGKASFGRILVTPVILIIAGLLVGSVTGQTMIAVLVAVIVSIVYIVVASRR